MNQGLSTEFDAIVPALLASGLLSSLCTIKTPPETFTDSGALDPDALYADLAGHVDIPCIAAPLMTTDKVGIDEIKLRNETETLGLLHVLLGGYYPAIQTDYRAEIDGVDWDIVTVDSDSQGKTTRLAVRQRQTL